MKTLREMLKRAVGCWNFVDRRQPLGVALVLIFALGPWGCGEEEEKLAQYET